MRWENKSLRPIIPPPLHARDIALDAYNEGYINWNIYQKVLARINSNKNGSWMFEEFDLTDYKEYDII